MGFAEREAVVENVNFNEKLLDYDYLIIQDELEHKLKQSNYTIYFTETEEICSNRTANIMSQYMPTW